MIQFPKIVEVIEMQRGRLFLWVPVCLSVGIGLYFSRATEPLAGLVYVVSIFVVILICCALIEVRAAISIVIWAAILVGVGFLLAVNRTHQIKAPVLSWHYYGVVEGKIVHIDRSYSDRPRITLKDPVLAKISVENIPKLVRVSLHSEEGVEYLKPGAKVRTIASLSPPAGPAEPGGFDFQQYAWFKQLGAVGYSRKPVEIIQKPNIDTYALYIFDLRQRISTHIRNRIEGQPGAFAAAIIVGDRGAIDQAHQDDLRASNLAHLLAISGLHMGLLVGFIFALVRYGLAIIPYTALHWPLKKIGAFIALLIGFVYLQLSGSAVATERAFIMVGVMLVGVMLDRPAITLRAVALAATILLLYRPESLQQAGFQMSFAATTGLVASFEFLRHQRRWQAIQYGYLSKVQPVIGLFMSSFIAGAATAPFAAYHFNIIAQYGLIANLLSVPLMGSVVMPAAVAGAILSPIGLDAIPFWIMGKGIEWILAVAGWVSSFDGAIKAVKQGGDYILPLFTFGVIFLILWQGRLKWIGPVMVIVAISMWYHTTRPDVLVSANGRMMGIMYDEGRAINRIKGNGFSARVWLENDGDRVSQEFAANRSTKFSDEMLITIKGVDIAYIWSKKALVSVLTNLCKTSDIMISPNYMGKINGDCHHIDQKDFTIGGSVAIRISDGIPDVQNARQKAGSRLWNSWWLQKPGN